jgi:magnesium transporter
VSKLTALGVVFMPINIIAGIGGMSEFSMMTAGIPWPVSYGLLTVFFVLLGFSTYYGLRYFENREMPRLLTRSRKEG